MVADSERPQKRMRKGTKSCTECRRRKIRCKYLPGYDDCAQCSVRGSKCNSQGPTGPDEGHDEEEPISPVATVGVSPAASSLPPQRTTAEIDDDFDLEISKGSRPPLVSMLNHGKTASSALFYERGDGSQNSNLCETLRANLPSYDVVISALAKNGSWWDSFRQKTRVVTQAGLIEEPPLLAFAAQVYTSPSPAKLGILVAAYGRSLVPDPEGHRLLRLVDELVISNMAVGSSLDGMECLVLLAKTHTDVGQPRRAWLMWRKGLATAQLLGLHRFALDPTDRRQRIWMAIYHGDRFTSLLLGLPHGFNDSHLIDGPSSSDAPVRPGTTLEHWITQFVHECAVVAGKVIESILLPARPSFATAMQLDERLEAAFGSAPPGWWDLSALGGSGDTDNFLVDKLLIHFFFFHVLLYTHLAFLKSDTPSPSYTVSRAVCTGAARNLLQRFIILRTKVNGVWLFDCKTSDFVGFTAAVVLLIGIRGSSGDQSTSLQEDEQLIRQAERIFQGLENRGCKMSSQCRSALALLSRQSHDQGPQSIFIPYFGTVRLATTSAWHHDQRHPAPPETSSATLSSGTTLAPGTDYNESCDAGVSIDYLGYQQSQDMFPATDLTGEGLAGDHHLTTFQGVDLTCLDIDQDWSLFVSTME